MCVACWLSLPRLSCSLPLCEKPVLSAGVCEPSASGIVAAPGGIECPAEASERLGGSQLSAPAGPLELSVDACL